MAKAKAKAKKSKDSDPFDPAPIARIRELGFKVFDEHDFDVNIVIARNPEQQPNKFSDLIFVSWLEQGEWKTKSWTCTSEPGTYWLRAPMRKTGCALLMHDKQYRSAFRQGRHKGVYPCLVSVGSIEVWRDNTRDDLIDYGELKTSSSRGIQIHRANSRYKSRRIGKWSAGCCVINEGYDSFIETIRLQTEHHPSWQKYSVSVIQWDGRS